RSRCAATPRRGPPPPEGGAASSEYTSRIETPKTHGQQPYAWPRHIPERLPAANSVEDYEALLTCNCSPASAPAS
ncbi:transposase domain-containing protein, partial [Ectopseudomonas mendocina]